eukprot:m.121842 g.121842  ORF g.121842 m.121842 type:complete len:542 (-) comp15648_c0_seq16:2366-3991(-)
MLKRRDTGLNSRRVSAGTVGATSEATFRCCVIASPGLQQEVNLLQTNVIPAVKALAKAYGVDMLVTVLNFGHSDAAQQRAGFWEHAEWVHEQCKKLSGDISLLVLTGDKYGQESPPPSMKASLFEAILANNPPNVNELKDWYQLNACTQEYTLKAPTTKFAKWPTDAKQAQQYSQLQDTLGQALKEGIKDLNATDQERMLCAVSGFHRFLADAVLNAEIHPNLLVFQRVVNKGQDPTPAQCKLYPHWFDLNNNGEVDVDATRRARQINYELEQSVLADKRSIFGVEVEGTDAEQDAAAIDDYISEWSLAIKAKLVEVVEQLAAGKSTENVTAILASNHTQTMADPFAVDLKDAAMTLGLGQSSREFFEVTAEQSSNNASTEPSEWVAFNTSPERRALSFEDIAQATAGSGIDLLAVPAPLAGHSRSKSLDTILWPDGARGVSSHSLPVGIDSDPESGHEHDDDGNATTQDTPTERPEVVRLRDLPPAERLEALKNLQASLTQQNIALRYEHDELSMQVSEVRNRKAILKGQLAARNADSNT